MNHGRSYLDILHSDLEVSCVIFGAVTHNVDIRLFNCRIEGKPDCLFFELIMMINEGVSFITQALKVGKLETRLWWRLNLLNFDGRCQEG